MALRALQRAQARPHAGHQRRGRSGAHSSARIHAHNPHPHNTAKGPTWRTRWGPSRAGLSRRDALCQIIKRQIIKRQITW